MLRNSYFILFGFILALNSITSAQTPTTKPTSDAHLRIRLYIDNPDAISGVGFVIAVQNNTANIVSLETAGAIILGRFDGYLSKGEPKLRIAIFVENMTHTNRVETYFDNSFQGVGSPDPLVVGKNGSTGFMQRSFIIGDSATYEATAIAFRGDVLVAKSNSITFKGRLRGTRVIEENGRSLIVPEGN